MIPRVRRPARVPPPTHRTRFAVTTVPDPARPSVCARRTRTYLSLSSVQETLACHCHYVFVGHEIANYEVSQHLHVGQGRSADHRCLI